MRLIQIIIGVAALMLAPGYAQVTPITNLGVLHIPQTCALAALALMAALTVLIRRALRPVRPIRGATA